MRQNDEKQRAKAVAAAVAQAKTGTYQIAIEFQLLDLGPSQSITYYGPLSDAAFEYTMKAIRTAGFTGADLSDLSSLCDGSAPEVVLVIGDDEYEGKITRKVKFVNSMGGLAVTNALQGNDLKSFAQKMKGKILAYDQSTGAPRQQAQRKPPRDSGRVPQEVLDGQANQHGGSDDIPF